MSDMFRFLLGRILTIHAVVTLLAFLIVKIGVISTAHSTATTTHKSVVVATTRLASEAKPQTATKPAVVLPARIAAQTSVMNAFSNWSVWFDQQTAQMPNNPPTAKRH